MARPRFRLLLLSVSLTPLVPLLLFGTGGSSPEVVDLEGGATVFRVPTNLPGLQVEGKSTLVRGRVKVTSSEGGLVLQQIEVSVPVRSLATGIALRDEHMRKYIFTAADGAVPDIEFKGERAECSASVPVQEFVCPVTGQLSFRGLSRPWSLKLRARKQAGAVSTYRAAGDAVVKLSDYSITRPSQFGVKPANEVKVHVEFTGKQSAAVLSSTGSLP